MTRITLIRHGETDWNLAGRIQGATDIPLNDTGRRQAAEAAQSLVLSGRPVLLAASDLGRARETAEIIGRAHGWGVPLEVPALRERAYGEAEGRTVDDFVADYGAWPTAVVPGAETREELRSRAVSALHQLARAARRQAPLAVDVVAVSHGALIGELLRAVSDDELPPPGRKVTNGSAHTFLVDPHRIVLQRSAVLV